MSTGSRDLRGRIAGALLFSAFLVFHLFYMATGWKAFDGPARANSLLITATIICFLASYFLRRPSVSFPQGLKETLYPLFCAGLPLVIYHNAELLRFAPSSIPGYALLPFLFKTSSSSPFGWSLASIMLVLTGNCITLLGIISLRRSFSIMVEARELVSTGLYAYVRHPLYAGEIVAAMGVLLFRFSPANVVLLLLFITGQAYRASLEERKLLSAFPGYERYRKNTGAFFPRMIFRRGPEKTRHF